MGLYQSRLLCRIIRRFPAGIVACGSSVPETVGGIEGVAADKETFYICHQVPVVHESSGEAEKLSLLREKLCAGPAHPVTLQYVFFRVKTGFRKVLIDWDVGFAFLTDHHAPDDFPLHLRHQREIRIERKLVAHIL